MGRLTNDLNGMIVINKEAGYTSSDVVARLRGILHMKRIGHTGTLDPDVVGVLPVCLGMGTRLVDLIADRDKEYECVMRLGIKTDTQDMSGTVIDQMTDEELQSHLEGQDIAAACTAFIGGYDQIPPMYSAVWVNGQRLYDLARKGQVIEREPRHVEIHDLEVKEINVPYVTFRVVCSKGTYIRTLCEDIGARLDIPAAMEHLVRTRVGIFTLDQALTLDEVKVIIDAGEPVMEDRNGNPIGNNVAGVREHIIPIDAFFCDAPAVHVLDADRKYLQNGNPLGADNCREQAIPHAERIRVYDEADTFWALYHYDAGRDRILPVKMFHVTDSVGVGK